MLNKDRDGKNSPFVILLVALLGMGCMVLGVVVMPSSKVGSRSDKISWVG